MDKNNFVHGRTTNRNDHMIMWIFELVETAAGKIQRVFERLLVRLVAGRAASRRAAPRHRMEHPHIMITLELEGVLVVA